MDIRSNTGNKLNTTTVRAKLDSSFKIRFEVDVLVIKKVVVIAFEVIFSLLLFRRESTCTVVLLQTSGT